jgi:hypothetical protein
VGNSGVDKEKERRELRILVEQIKSDSGCVLVLGPRIAVRAEDPARRPLDEILAGELVSSLKTAAKEPPPSLRRAADLHYKENRSRAALEIDVRDFYARETNSTTNFHRHLAQLPFRLCISASPDSLMLTAFEAAGKRPQRDYYSFQAQRRGKRAGVVAPTVESPLVYYLFGHHDDGASLVLTEADLIEYLVQIIKGDPPIPDEVRSILRDPYASFLFIGFGFQNWYLRVLLKVLDVYGHRNAAIAFEDRQFFEHPDKEQATAFFSEDRTIEFRDLRWEPFALELLGAYESSLPRPPPQSPGRNAPVAFVSYASEDLETVDKLREAIESKGIKVWQDKQNLRAGDKWNDVLHSLIKNENEVDYVIVVQTTSMVNSVSGVFHREIKAARERQDDMGEFEGQRLRFLIPIRVGDSGLLSDLSEFHAPDVSGSGGVDLLVISIMEDWERRAKLMLRGRRAA